MIAVGGPLDGQRLDEPLDDRKVVVFPIPQPLGEPGPECAQLAWHKCYYHVEKIHTPEHTFRFYRHESLTTTDAIDVLLKGYKP